MNSSVSRTSIIGDIGEALVASEFGFIPNADPYDVTCDMRTPYNQTVEVKTQARYNHLLTIPYAHLKKCSKVDILLFVEYCSSDYIKIWSCKDRKNYTKFITRRSYPMLGYEINDMTLLKKIKNKPIAELLKHYSNDAKFRTYRYCDKASRRREGIDSCSS